MKPFSKIAAPWALGGFFSLWVFFISLRRIYDFDYWTHLAMGRHFLAQGLTFFLSPANFFASRYITWPFQVMVYGVYDIGSHPLVSIMVALLAAAIFLPLLLRLLPRQELSKSLLLLFFLAALAATALFRFVPRPELLSYLFFTVAMALTCSWAEKPSWRKLFAVAIILLLWKPLHPTLYIGGPLVLLTGVLLSDWRQWLRWRGAGHKILLAAMLAAAIPLLYLAGRFAFFVYSLLGSGGVLAGVVEMRPTWHFPWVFGQFLAVTALAAALAALVPAGRWTRLGLILLAFLPGLLVVRNVPLTLFFMAFMAVEGLRPWTPPRWVDGRRRLWAAAVLTLCIGLGGYQFARTDNPWGVGAQWELYPKEAARHFQTANRPAPVFNNWDWGGYLLWAWEKNPLPFMDGRFGGNKTKMGDYERILDGADHQQLLDQYGINTILLRPFYPDSGRLHPVIAKLLFDPRWVLVDASDALLFVRDTELPHGQGLAPKEGWSLILRLADVLERTDPSDHPHLDFTRSLAYMGFGDFASAQQMFQRGAQHFPEIARQYSSR